MTSEAFLSGTNGGLFDPLMDSTNGWSSGGGTFGTLKVSKVPLDLSLREATTIFALVIDDLASVEIRDGTVMAHFNNFQTCETAGKLLDGKHIFGKEFGPVKIEFDQKIESPSSTINPGLNAGFSNLRLGLTQASDFQKRQSFGNQRSRFLFGDPFMGSTQAHPASGSPVLQHIASQPTQLQSQPASLQVQHGHPPLMKQPSSSSLSQGQHYQHQQLHQQPSQHSSSHPQTQPQVDLPLLSGKSMFLMDNENQGPLIRDPWGNHLSINSAPQTPGATSLTNGPLDWNAQGVPPSKPSQSQSQNSVDRKRPSNYFNSNLFPGLSSGLPIGSLNSLGFNQSQKSPIGSRILGPQLAGTQSGPAASFSQPVTSDLTNAGAIPEHISSQPSEEGMVHQDKISPNSSNQQQQTTPSSGRLPQQSLQPQMHQQLQAAQSTISLSNSNSGTLLAHPMASRDSGQPPQSGLMELQESPTTEENTSKKDLPDLSLLAKVPPPANPADQNPPCNTLYVGNLPPDATEQELRALFSTQKGFKRLSFRTKNQALSASGQSSGHNHGPMCFVEFEDVALATRALADLYGRTLPRSGPSNGKGGIRLSFSKNPLGVRGPGNPRRTSNSVFNNPSATNSKNSGINTYSYLTSMKQS